MRNVIGRILHESYSDEDDLYYYEEHKDVVERILEAIGFTWEDVERHLARADLTADLSESAWCRSMADRIAALLPPR